MLEDPEVYLDKELLLKLRAIIPSLRDREQRQEQGMHYLCLSTGDAALLGCNQRLLYEIFYSWGRIRELSTSVLKSTARRKRREAAGRRPTVPPLKS